MNKKQKKMLIRIIIAAVLIVVFSLLPAEGYLRFVLFMIPYLVIATAALITTGAIFFISFLFVMFFSSSKIFLRNHSYQRVNQLINQRDFTFTKRE